MEIFDEKIERLLEAGLIDYFNSDYLEQIKINSKRYEHFHPEGPEVLSLEHLRAGFAIWLGSIIFAMLSFVGEWVVRLKDFLIFRGLISKVL